MLTDDTSTHNQYTLGQMEHRTEHLDIILPWKSRTGRRSEGLKGACVEGIRKRLGIPNTKFNKLKERKQEKQK